ncbi:hypothetical protein H6P81_007093 [Aristolochia fimbriata]|uniref:Uncharacterized protein n=1 Tax=Aristolochia fimbriata TaxID=158543 RepID=A0AAV7F0B3_ARIFI|nr:hypothetical protein H6P81_007093 [Aristolochia fimbriata]
MATTADVGQDKKGREIDQQSRARLGSGALSTNELRSAETLGDYATAEGEQEEIEQGKERRGSQREGKAKSPNRQIVRESKAAGIREIKLLIRGLVFFQ